MHLIRLEKAFDDLEVNGVIVNDEDIRLRSDEALRELITVERLDRSFGKNGSKYRGIYGTAHNENVLITRRQFILIEHQDDLRLAVILTEFTDLVRELIEKRLGYEEIRICRVGCGIKILDLRSKTRGNTEALKVSSCLIAIDRLLVKVKDMSGLIRRNARERFLLGDILVKFK